MQNLRIFFGIALMLFSDLLIHFGLGELRLIDFVVSIFSVTNQIYQNVFFEFLLVLHTKVHYSVNVFNVL